MIKIGPKKFLIQSTAELPLPESIDELFCDVETTQYTRVQKLKDPKAVHPYCGDRICGIAITWDNNPDAYYIPIRHRSIGKDINLDINAVMAWMREILKRSKKWINHNVKFDAHFFHVDGVSFGNIELVCTQTLAKTMDTDRFNHRLKPLCREWCGLEMPEEGRIAAYLKQIKSKDYARVPADLMGDYACQDVLGNRTLYRWLLKHKEPEYERIWRNEILYTPVLFDMETEGVKINEQLCKIEGAKSLHKMIQAAEFIRKEVGVELVDSNDCFYEIFCIQLGLPVLWRTGKGGLTGNPSFDKDALALYRGHPDVIYNERSMKIINACAEYRKEETFKGLYVDSFLEKMDSNHRIHPNHNQLIRTGRGSCSDPNTQQLSPRAKELVVPDEAFICQDAAQIEFRLIAHVAKMARVIAQYAADPDTDFHNFVKDICQTERDPAKTLNFTMGYGAGRPTVTRKLSMDKDVMKRGLTEVDRIMSLGKHTDTARPRLYADICKVLADNIYSTYHKEFPEIKATSERCRVLAGQRGYIRNAYGRRRHLPHGFENKAFNSSVQGLAMDVIKERTIAIAPRYCQWTRDLGIKIRLNVHDEVLEEAPKAVAFDQRVRTKLIEALQAVEVPLRVPIRWHDGVSDKHWREAKGD